MLIRLAALAAALLDSKQPGADSLGLTAPVVGHPDKTWADLVGQYVTEPVTSACVVVQRFRSGGKAMLAVHSDDDAGSDWLAVFDADLELVDFAEVDASHSGDADEDLPISYDEGFGSLATGTNARELRRAIRA